MTNAVHKNRITSIDMLRGLVMVIMALDHTRDFLHIGAMTADPLDPATTTIPLYFTRWITHFCAPVFVLLSGISAWLSAQHKPIGKASRFMITRGFWLIFVEIVIITLAITFNPFYNFIILQVIWAIGWSMVLLGLLMRSSFKIILFTGIVLLIGHNFLKYLPLPSEGALAALLQISLTSRSAVIPLSENHTLAVLYAILPWTAVMLLGYCIGPWFAASVDPQKRKKRLRITGLVLIVIFITLRSLNNFGDQQPWTYYPVFWQNVFSFLNTTKYPPSLQYVCMTLGPALLLLSLLEKRTFGLERLLSVYGRVPFFYYVLHFYLIHFITVILFFASGYKSTQIVSPTPFYFRPPAFGFDLPYVYLVWLLVVGSLYYPCKWFQQYKLTHKANWLKFV